LFFLGFFFVVWGVGGGQDRRASRTDGETPRQVQTSRHHLRMCFYKGAQLITEKGGEWGQKAQILEKRFEHKIPDFEDWGPKREPQNKRIDRNKKKT